MLPYLHTHTHTHTHAILPPHTHTHFLPSHTSTHTENAALPCSTSTVTVVVYRGFIGSDVQCDHRGLSQCSRREIQIICRLVCIAPIWGLAVMGFSDSFIAILGPSNIITAIMGLVIVLLL